jgi:hypothetical protein
VVEVVLVQLQQKDLPLKEMVDQVEVVNLEHLMLLEMEIHLQSVHLKVIMEERDLIKILLILLVAAVVLHKLELQLLPVTLEQMVELVQQQISQDHLLLKLEVVEVEQHKDFLQDLVELVEEVTEHQDQEMGHLDLQTLAVVEVLEQEQTLVL